jgi:large subunit ribosomal protein L4
MAQVEVIDMSNNKVGVTDLNDLIFNGEVKTHLISDVIRMQLANRRSGTAATKNRSMIRGGGKKPYRQKGTGRARAGALRAPGRVGGGCVFGPTPRDFSLHYPKKVRKAALRSALSMKLQEKNLTVVNDVQLNEIKTKNVANFLKLIDHKNALIVVSGEETNFIRSARNIDGIKVLNVQGLNVYDLVKYEKLVLPLPIISKIEGALLS